MKKVFFLLMIIPAILAPSLTWAEEITPTKEEVYFTNRMGLGWVQAGDVGALVYVWRPLLSQGKLNVQMDVNINLGNQTPPRSQDVVLTRAEYLGEVLGMKYGPIERTTLGYGLLMNNYASDDLGPILPSNRQMGVKAYYNSNTFAFVGLVTASSLYGFRFTEQFDSRYLLGQTYVYDGNGLTDIKVAGAMVNYTQESGMSFDLTVPIDRIILGGKPSLYTEMALLAGRGSGLALGFFNEYVLLNLGTTYFRAERVFTTGNFVPRFFNEQYEVNPLDLANSPIANKSKDGYLLQLKTVLFDTFKLKTTYEDYEESNPLLSMQLDFPSPRQGYATLAYYQVNFQGVRTMPAHSGGVVLAKFSHQIEPTLGIEIGYKQVNDPFEARVYDSKVFLVQKIF